MASISSIWILDNTLSNALLIPRAPTFKAKAKHCINCAICTEDIKIGDDLFMLKCPGKHFFHADCIKTWLNVKLVCPMCRSENILF